MKIVVGATSREGFLDCSGLLLSAHAHLILFNWASFYSYSTLSHVDKTESFRMIGVCILQAGCLWCHLANSVEALSVRRLTGNSTNEFSLKFFKDAGLNSRNDL